MYQHHISGNIRHHECDADGGLKLNCLLDRLQDAAAEHAQFLNVGMSELAEMKLIWVLSRLKIRLDHPLKLGDMLDVRTYPSGVQRIFAHRCYELLSGGRRAGYAGSFWLPVNMLSGRPVNARKVLPPEILELPEVEKFFPDMDNLELPETDICAERRIGAGDVDLNRHLNNAVYARWTVDVLGDVLQEVSPQVREVQFNYLSSGQFGESVFLKAATGSDGKFTVSGEKEDKTPLFCAVGILG
ncbi:MAG: hypothetical protein J6S43_04495 [Lentisphaeria bacterium]|nr:hypothetical protein [Lentisphaeria bacterium]